MTKYAVGFARHIKRIKSVSLHLYYSRAICYQIQSTMANVYKHVKRDLHSLATIICGPVHLRLLDCKK